MPEYIFKEVRFDKYCASCKHSSATDTEEPCNTCLGYPVNEYSEKPVKFIEKEG